MHKLVGAYRRLGQADAALSMATEAVRLAEARHARDPRIQHAQGAYLAQLDLGLAYLDGGRPAEAVRQFVEAERWVAVNYPKGRIFARYLLGRAYRAAGRPAEARPLLEAALAGAPAGDDLTTSRFQESLGEALLDLKDWGAAERVLRDCLTTRRRRNPKAWTTPATASLLGAALAGQRKFAEAEPLLLDGYRELAARVSDIAPVDRPWLAQAADRVANLYGVLDRPAEVARWRAERAKYPLEVAPPPRPGE